MSSLAKCLFGTIKFVQRSIDVSRISVSACQKNSRSVLMNRVSRSYDINSNLIVERSRESEGKEDFNFLLCSVAAFFGLFKFGKSSEEEEGEVPELIMMIKRSVLLIQKGEYKKAEQMLHVALRQAQALQHFEAITYIQDVMANLAFDVEDYEKAEALFVSVMQRLISTGTPQDDPKIIHMSLKVAKMYERRGDFQKAENGYQFCLKNLETRFDKNTEDEDVILLWAMALDWYARMLITQNRYTEAFKRFLQAYQMSVKVNGEEHEQTVMLLNDLGTISFMKGEHDEAIDYLTEAAEIGKKLPEMTDLGSIHVNLGNVFMKKGLYEAAKKSCQEGWKLSKTRNNEESLVEAKDCLDEIKRLLS